jgi:hypothetical protein
MVPPETVQGKIVVVFVEPGGEDGGPNRVVGTHEFLVDIPERGAR